MKEVASKNDPGDYYQMKFPYTKEYVILMLLNVYVLGICTCIIIYVVQNH